MDSRISVGPSCAAKRESTIRVAVDRLERSLNGLEELVASAASAFGPVIFQQPSGAEPAGERVEISGSDLGRELTKLASRLDRLNRSLLTIVEQSDV